MHGGSNQYTHGSPDGYTNNGTGKTSDLALNSSEGPNAQLHPGDTQSSFPNFCPTPIDASGMFNQGSDLAYGSNPIIQPQTVEPPPVPSPTHEQGTFGSVSVNPKQYNAILRRRQLRKMSPPSQENLIAIRMRDISRALQSAANKRPRGEDGRFISMNQPQSGSSTGGAYNNVQQFGSSVVQPRSSNYYHISTANKTDQRLIILVPENSDESGATINTGTLCWQEKSNTQNSSTQCRALVQSDLAVLPPPISEPALEFTFSPNTSNLINLDDIEFDMTGMFGEPTVDGVGSSVTAPVVGEMVLPTMLRDRLCALKEHLIQNPAETFVNNVSVVQDILSGIANTELPTDTYLAICEILSLMDIGPAYNAAKERQKKREDLIGLTHRLSASKSIVASSFWRFQEEQKFLAVHKVSKANLQQKIAALEEELNRTKSQLVNVSSLIIKQMGRLKNLQEEGHKAKENADALEAELNDQITVLGGAQADEELVGRPARVVEAAKQRIDTLLDKNP